MRINRIIADTAGTRISRSMANFPTRISFQVNSDELGGVRPNGQNIGSAIKLTCIGIFGPGIS